MSSQEISVCTVCGKKIEAGSSKKCKCDVLIDQKKELDHAISKSENHFGKYVLIKEIGYGGMGTVYKAWQKDLRRYVALKFPSGNMKDEEQKRFLREAQLGAKLSHPNIAQIYEINVESSKPYIAMQHIDGKTVDNLKELPLSDKVRMLVEASKAVDYAHGQGIVHRDLKPSNIMTSSTGTVYVMDFGLAKAVEQGQTVTMSGVVMGTPPYMSPEQALGGTVDRKSDVYSLGAILYEFITSIPPFYEETALGTINQILCEDPKPIKMLNPKCPKDLATICIKALSKEKDRRYQSAKEFADDLNRFLAGEPILAKPPSLTYKIVTRLKKRKAIAITMFISLVIIAAAGVLIFSQQQAQILSEGQKWARIKQYIAEAKQAIQSGDWLKAKEKVDRVIALDQANEHAKILLVTIKPQVELYSAVKDLPQGARDAISRANKLILDARKLEGFNYKEWSSILGETIVTLSMASRHESWTINFILGELYREYYEIDNAINHFSKAIELARGNKLLYFARAEAYIIKMFQEYWWLKEFGIFQTDLLESASKDLTMAQGITLKDEDSEYLAILEKITRGEGDGVLKLFTVNSIRFSRLKTGFLLFLGRFGDCNAECAKIIESFPAYMPAYYFRSSARIGLGDYQGALDDCKIALSLREDLNELHFQTGIAFDKSKKFGDAVSVFSNVITLNTNSAEAWAYRGVSYFKKGDYKNAIKDWTTASSMSKPLEKSLKPLLEAARSELKR